VRQKVDQGAGQLSLSHMTNNLDQEEIEIKHKNWRANQPGI